MESLIKKGHEHITKCVPHDDDDDDDLTEIQLHNQKCKWRVLLERFKHEIPIQRRKQIYKYCFQVVVDFEA
jgi:hypothetical protein